MIKVLKLSQLTSRQKEKIFKRNPPMLHSAKGGFDKNVSSILKAVKARGDKAVQAFNKKWSKTESDPLYYNEKEFVRSLSRIPLEVKGALIKASREIRAFHRKQVRKELTCSLKGRKLGMRFVPHENVAVYVPGGKALYPSSVLMGVIPAKLAGVKNVIILSPPGPDGKVNDYVLAAAALTDATGLYATGGAQAIAAAVYGTDLLPRASLVVGPGNNYVMRAKWQLSIEENIAIDSPAGPSEVLIIVEKDVVDPNWVVADMLSQAEHGEDSPSVVLTTSESFAALIVQSLEARLGENSQRNKIKRKAIKGSGNILICDSLDEAIEFSNIYAPEHLQIMTRNDSYVLDRITRAGSVFVGPFSPVAAGDYSSGTNHVLPTGGLAGIYSGLGVETFYRTFSYQRLSRKGLSSIADTIRVLSKVEGLDEEHGRSVDIRLRK